MALSDGYVYRTTLTFNNEAGPKTTGTITDPDDRKSYKLVFDMQNTGGSAANLNMVLNGLTGSDMNNSLITANSLGNYGTNTTSIRVGQCATDGGIVGELLLNARKFGTTNYVVGKLDIASDVNSQSLGNFIRANIGGTDTHVTEISFEASSGDTFTGEIHIFELVV